ncbi:hypothetical protein [Novosphingopyxis sp.]|uniref:hypothetical protein n=1 Tax=Novosphingopyxis sp. TaxID=2709690 RepID=UPI003B5A5869
MKRSYLIAALGISLAACNSGPVDEPLAADDMATPAVTNDTAAPAMPPAPSATVPVADDETGDSSAMATIPAALQGRWGINPADCTTTNGDDKGLITVGADRIRFYESTARLGKISESSDSRIVADFSFSGEGQSWTKGMTLDAQDGGKTLIRRETGEDAMPGPERYRKCG